MSNKTWSIWDAAMRSNLGLPTDVELIAMGLRGLSYPASTTVREACDRIISGAKSGELESRVGE